MKDILHLFEKSYEHIGIECFSISVCLPGGFGVNGKNNLIDKYYQHKQKQIIKNVEKCFLPLAQKETEAAVSGTGVFRPWLLKGLCTVTYLSDSYISFFREYTVYRGKSPYAYAYESETWALPSRQLCPIDVFIRDNKTARKFLQEYARRDKELKKYFLKNFDKDNYYLTQNGIVIFYPDRKLHIPFSNTKDFIV